VHWVNEFFGLKGEDRINKIKIHKLARWVIDQYDEHGRLTAISDQELEAKVKELMPEYWAKYKGKLDTGYSILDTRRESRIENRDSDF